MASEEVLSQERRARRAQWVTRKIRRHEDSDEFDRAFWLQMDPIQRMLQGWLLTVEAFAMKGISEGELRVSRSVARVQRRKR